MFLPPCRFRLSALLALLLLILLIPSSGAGEGAMSPAGTAPRQLHAPRQSHAPRQQRTPPPPATAGEAEEEEWVRGAGARYERGPAPPFQVRSRKSELEAFPCGDCHEGEPANPKERKLEEEHEDIVLHHGRGRFWCLTCHDGQAKDALISLKGTDIDFDQSYILCGQCHFQRQKDWYFGGHGKRLSGWRAGRRIAMCVECHDPHSPSIKPFRPAPPPRSRKGLPDNRFRHRFHAKAWETTPDGGGAH